MRLFSEFWTRPKVRNRSKRHFAKFLPFAGLCNLFAAFKQVVKQSSIISADTAGHVQNPVEVLEQLRNENNDQFLHFSWPLPTYVCLSVRNLLFAP